MARKSQTRVKSAQELADEREFSRRQNMSPYIQVRRMPGRNTYDVELTLGSKTVASKTERLRSGKVVSAHYFLPPIGPIEEQLREYMARPLARDARRPLPRSARRTSPVSSRGRDRDPAEPFSVSLTYEIITPESAEHGDVEDQGYDYKDKRMSLSDVVREVESHGPYDEVQEIPDRRGALLRLYESDGDTDWRTGAETRHALHIRGSERAIRRLAQVLEQRGVGRDHARPRRRRR